MVHRFARRVIQLEAHAAFGELVLPVEHDLRRDITAFARTQQVDTQRGTALFARHVGGPLHFVQLAVVAHHQAIFAHLLDVVLLRDHLRIGPREDLRAVDVIAMKVGIDDVADGQRGDLAEIVEGCLGGRLAFGGIDHHYAVVRQYEDDIAQRVAGGAIDLRIDADEFGRILRELGGGGQAGEKQQDGREGSHLAPYKSGSSGPAQAGTQAGGLPHLSFLPIINQLSIRPRLTGGRGSPGSGTRTIRRSDPCPAWPGMAGWNRAAPASGAADRPTPKARRRRGPRGHRGPWFRGRSYAPFLRAGRASSGGSCRGPRRARRRNRQGRGSDGRRPAPRTFWLAPG